MYALTKVHLILGRNHPVPRLLPFVSPCIFMSVYCICLWLYRPQSESKASEAASALKCSHAEFLLATEAFCCSLQSVVLSLDHDDQHFLMDLTHAHCWVTEEDAHLQTTALHPCNCGLVKERTDLEKIFLNTPLKTAHQSFLPAPITSDVQPGLLDSYTAKLNALNVAVETANLVLSARYIIRDMN